MKIKFLFLPMLIFCLFKAQAQSSVSNFEFPNVPVSGYWDGADFGGGFQSGSSYFRNSYDTSFGFGFWSGGFAWSTTTDSVTSGFTNQMSAKAAGGHNSAGYGIGQQNSIVVLNNGLAAQPQSVRLSNSTYAYNSMRDGDTFAKKFGGLSGNDPDFFKLVIKPYSGGTLLNDSVEFYLADFRFSNNALDYIVSTWDSVDLSSLPVCDSLKFTLSSSDTGAFGMNTPAYFCLDDFSIELNPNALKKEKKKGVISAFPNPSAGEALRLQAQDMSYYTYQLRDVSGGLILEGSFTGQTTLPTEKLPAGVYYLQCGNEMNREVFPWIKQ